MQRKSNGDTKLEVGAVSWLASRLQLSLHFFPAISIKPICYQVSKMVSAGRVSSLKSQSLHMDAESLPSWFWLPIFRAALDQQKRGA